MCGGNYSGCCGCSLHTIVMIIAVLTGLLAMAGIIYFIVVLVRNKNGDTGRSMSPRYLSDDTLMKSLYSVCREGWGRQAQTYDDPEEYKPWTKRNVSRSTHTKSVHKRFEANGSVNETTTDNKTAAARSAFGGPAAGAPYREVGDLWDTIAGSNGSGSKFSMTGAGDAIRSVGRAVRPPMPGERVERRLEKVRRPRHSDAECDHLVHTEMDRLAEERASLGRGGLGRDANTSSDAAADGNEHVRTTVILLALIMCIVIFLASIMLMYGVALDCACLFLPYLTLLWAWVLAMIIALLILPVVHSHSNTGDIIIMYVITVLLIIFAFIAIWVVWCLLKQIIVLADQGINEGVIESMHLLISGRN